MAKILAIGFCLVAMPVVYSTLFSPVRSETGSETPAGFRSDVAQPVNVENQEESRAKAIFEERIMPIFRSPDPSSCIQCHLSSVDLKNYILPSHEGTFVSLRDQGLINMDDPDASKILELINMGGKDADDDSRRIHADMRNAEYEAFANWIKTSCKDERLRQLPPLDESQLAKPARPNEVIRHARKSRVVNSFVRKIWSQRMRCFPCHTPNEIGPRQKGARKKFQDWQDQYGDQMLIFKETPEETLQYLIEESRQATEDYLPLINLQDPIKSLLVLKPMSKIPPKDGDKRLPPTYTPPVYHMGGLKIHKDDHTYKAFLSWIEDYARVTAGLYSRVEDLPADNWFPTRRVLRMKNVPESWAVGTPVQLFVFNRSDENSAQTRTPIAFTQGTITPRRIVNGPLILLAPTDETEFQNWKQRKSRVPSGDYLIKVYVDTRATLEHQPTSFLTERDFQGQIVLNNAKWRFGFPKAEWIDASELKQESHNEP